MPRSPSAPSPHPAAQPGQRRIVNSPWNTPIATREERKQRDREASKHDGLCIRQMPELSGCRCNCKQCWDKAASKVICSADFSAFPLGS